MFLRDRRLSMSEMPEMMIWEDSGCSYWSLDSMKVSPRFPLIVDVLHKEGLTLTVRF